MNSIFSIDALAAGKGDCLILYLGKPDRPALALIDGGLVSTWKGPLHKRFLALREKLKIADDAALPLELVVVSHLDDDHMNGILKLVQDEVERRNAEPPFLEIFRFWNNTFDDVIDNLQGQLANGDSVQSALASAGLGVHGGADVLASLPKGRTLRDAIGPLRPELKVNPPFGPDNNVMAGGAEAFVPLGPVKITVVGPGTEQIADLQEKWDKFLEKKNLGQEAEAALAASELDTSITNLASIVMLISCEGASMLLTGDARGDHIMAGLKRAGLLLDGGEMAVDVLKIPHHGSPGNNSDNFLQRIKARHYIFSGNGSHGNPDRMTLERLLAACGGAEIDIHFTYDLATIDEKRKKHFEQHDDSWSDDENGLIQWVAATEAAHPEVTFHFGSEAAPIHVELGATPNWPGDGA